MITRRNGSPLTAASLLHVTPGDESLDQVAETYYSPANAGGMGRGEFRQQIVAANPHLKSSGSLLRADQLLRIDLRLRHSTAVMCRSDEVRRDLERCGEIWKTLPPSAREHLQEHSQLSHLMGILEENIPAFATGAAHGVEKILHNAMKGIGDVGALKDRVINASTSKTTHYALRAKKIEEIQKVLGSQLRKIATSKPINSALKVSAAQGRRARIILASEGGLEQLKLFEPMLSKMGRYAKGFSKGVFIGYAVDLGMKAYEVYEARPERRLELSLEKGVAFLGGLAGTSLGIAVAPAAAGGLTLVFFVASFTVLGDQVGEALGRLANGTGVLRYMTSNGRVHEAPHAILVGMCKIP